MNKRFVIESAGVIMPEDTFFDLTPVRGFSLDNSIISLPGCSLHKSIVFDTDDFNQAFIFFQKHYESSTAVWLLKEDVVKYFDPYYSSDLLPLFIVEFYLVDNKTRKRILGSDTSYDVMQDKGLLGSSSNYEGAISLIKEFNLGSDANIEIRFCGDIIIPTNINEIKEVELNSASISDEPSRNSITFL